MGPGWSRRKRSGAGPGRAGLAAGSWGVHPGSPPSPGGSSWPPQRAQAEASVPRAAGPGRWHRLSAPILLFLLLLSFCFPRGLNTREEQLPPLIPLPSTDIPRGREASGRVRRGPAARREGEEAAQAPHHLLERAAAGAEPALPADAVPGAARARRAGGTAGAHPDPGEDLVPEQALQVQEDPEAGPGWRRGGADPAQRPRPVPLLPGAAPALGPPRARQGPPAAPRGLHQHLRGLVPAPPAGRHPQGPHDVTLPPLQRHRVRRDTEGHRETPRDSERQ